MISDLTLALVALTGWALDDEIGRAALGFILGAALASAFWVLTAKLDRPRRPRRAASHRARRGKPATVAPAAALIPVETATDVMPRVPQIGHADWIGAASMRPARPLARSSR